MENIITDNMRLFLVFFAQFGKEAVLSAFGLFEHGDKMNIPRNVVKYAMVDSSNGMVNADTVDALEDAYNYVGQDILTEARGEDT